MPKNNDDLQLPNLPIKITRVGDKLKLVAGDYTLTLKQIPDKEQTYPLLILDKFITEVTTVLLKKELDKQENKKNTKKTLKLMGLNDNDQAVDNVIAQIHNDLFPEGK